ADAGITHRDIKPENIMRSSRGIVKVADFGLARLGADPGASRADLTQAGLTLGTPRYMSPEQVQGQVADVRSDLYSLGVSMYHLLAGRPPFEADDPLALAVLHLHETPMPLDRARGHRQADHPDVPAWLIAVVSRLMNKLPQDRFQSPSELLDAVRNEASESQLAHFGTVGTAAATIRLQRAADQERRHRRQRMLRRAVSILLPVGCVAAAIVIALGRPGKSVQTLLRPDEVQQADTIQEQYLIAVARHDEPGWRAVATFFPKDNSLNAAYHAKAMIQLALMFAGEEKWQAADDVLHGVLQDSELDRLYRAVALARRCQVLENLGGGQRLSDTRQQLKSLYLELQRSNPQLGEIFDGIVPEAERFQLGIETSGNGG
ncbi:MAG: serine/threonine protein kinase, partial [Pirellulales bacterium]|nr:serine/threonine protein kinase [Pirellulales bacterium]